MKTKSTLVTTIILLFFISVVNAQFNATGVLNTKYGRTNATFGQNIKAIGIGDFTSFPNAALHVDANLLDAPTDPINMFLPGEVFRTDGPSTNINAWRLWTGGQSGGSAASEKFSLFVPSNSSNVFFQASLVNSRFTFNTGGSQQRMIITQNNLNEPRVGIGKMNIPMAYLHLGEQTFSNIGG